MVLVIVFLRMKRPSGLYRDLLRQVAYPDQIDASRAQTQLAGAGLQGCLRDHLPQYRVYTHCDTLGCDDGDGAVAAVDLNAIACVRVIETFALDLAVGFMPLYFGKTGITKSQSEHHCQYGQQSSHRFESINKIITIFRSKQTFKEIFLFLPKIDAPQVKERYAHGTSLPPIKMLFKPVDYMAKRNPRLLNLLFVATLNLCVTRHPLSSVLKLPPRAT